MSGGASGVGGALPVPEMRAPSRLERWVIGILVTFLLLFPKGGIKVADVPITWGYLALAAVSLALPVALLRGQAWKIRPERLLLVAALIPFQLVVWLSFMINGLTGFGFAISLLVTFFFVPHVFLLVLGPPMDEMRLDFLFRWIRRGVLFVAAYGIFLFFYRLLVGEFFEIPLLTVNSGDLGQLDDKFIDRGGVFKLISTYNNGNIYGVCILMLLPLYTWLERRTLPKLVVKASLLLTLSRTVWAGLLLYEVLQRIYVRRVSLKSLAVLAVSLTVVIGGVLWAVDFIGVDPMAFLFDRQLGGRIGQLGVLAEATVLPQVSFLHILEMVYLSVLENFGAVGLVSYLIAMVAPIGMHLLRLVQFPTTEYKRSLTAGLIIYLVVSLSDGALLFIPVMAFYWFLASLLVSPNVGLARFAGHQRKHGSHDEIGRASNAAAPENAFATLDV